VTSSRVRPRLRRMLEGRTVAVVGASDRPDSFGSRMTSEALRSPGIARCWLVNPRHRTVLDRPCLPSLSDVPDPVDLVLLGVPTPAVAEQVRLASARGDGGAVIFGSAHGLRDELLAAADGLEVCGPGCMGFLNAVRGVRAIGYLERHPLPAGSIALVTHSGSVFSALLRTHRALDYSIAVSSGQELVTSMAEYVEHALDMPETRVIGLFAETLRDADRMQRGLARAAAQDVPVVALTVGGSPTGRQLVAAHSGAIAGDDAAWEALFSAYGVHRVDTLDELVDTLELFAIGRRVRPGTPRDGLAVATVHDSGGERALVADRADALGVRFAGLSDQTRDTLAPLLDPGLEATNPLDVWGRGSDTETLFAASLQALVGDPGVAGDQDCVRAHRQTRRRAEQHRQLSRPTSGGTTAGSRDPCPRGHALRPEGARSSAGAGVADAGTAVAHDRPCPVGSLAPCGRGRPGPGHRSAPARGLRHPRARDRPGEHGRGRDHRC
jgi:acyl-CoA synthetase (NDP forming)